MESTTMRAAQLTIPAIYTDMSKIIDIPMDRYKYIMNYLARMARDYKGDLIDILKEIPLNLKGKERYFAMFIIGYSFSPSFSNLNEERKAKIVTDIMNTLKISQDMAMIIASDMYNRILKAKKENVHVSTIDTIKKVIDGDLKDAEKDYASLMLGLTYK
jgi:hypothetical protein